MKLLVWNIRDFGINKIFDIRTRQAPNTGGSTYQQAAYERNVIIMRTVLFTDPDVIIVVEVSSGDSYPNDLASLTGGMLGSFRLLSRLRQDDPGAGWRLVPPMRIGRGGKAESMAVLYKGISQVGGANVNRYFTGPNVWTGGAAGSSVEPGPAPQQYPGPIDRMLVPAGTAARQIPTNALHNANRLENRMAARTRFRDFDNGNPGDFLDFSNLREPYMATFTETDQNGNLLQNVSLFGVHAPPNRIQGPAFVAALSTMYDIVGPLGNNETRVIGGDFNLNLLDNQGNYSGAYLPLTNNQYSVLLTPNGAAPAPLGPYPGYFTTHIKATDLSAASRFLWSWANHPPTSDYPAYGYFGSEIVRDFYSIDNLLVRPHNAAHDYRTTIMNHVTGSPFNGVNNPPGNPPIGSVPMVQSFMTVHWPPLPSAPNWTLGSARQLTGWVNYQHIYSTSDHIALYAEI